MAINVLTKALAGIQDLLFGQGTATQTRDGTALSISRIEMTKPLAVLTDLQALDVTDEDNFYPYAKTMGGVVLGDASGNEWWFDVTEPIASDNGSTIIAGNGAIVGCWKIIAAGIAAPTTAAVVSIVDLGGYYTGSNVEVALQELGVVFQHITVTQAVNLDTIEVDSLASKVITDFIVVTQAVNLDTIEINSLASKVITDFITTTQAIDLDKVLYFPDSASPAIANIATRASKFLGFNAAGELAYLTGGGSSTDAALVSILDTGGFYTGGDVEAALQEIGGVVTGPKLLLNTKFVEIGTWDMVASSATAVLHGIADKEKIRTISVMIRNDVISNDMQPLNRVLVGSNTTAQGGLGAISNTTISLYRLDSGLFDSTSFDTMGDDGNRGWVTIEYTD